jgi:ubiquinone/menaquinone biosynthesis C-methylase UbiE
VAPAFVRKRFDGGCRRRHRVCSKVERRELAYMRRQVDASHYDFMKYVDKSRWNSFYHQIDEIVSKKPASVLEVGVGTGFTRAVLKALGCMRYESMDVADDLAPDHVGSVAEMPFDDRQYDVVGCFQVLEHLPYADFEKALCEMCRVAREAVIISLPDAGAVWQIALPRLFRGNCMKKIVEERMYGRPFAKAIVHAFDGEHYWEINKKGYEFKKILARIKEAAGKSGYAVEKEYRVWENPYHHFFVLKNAGKR